MLHSCWPKMLVIYKIEYIFSQTMLGTSASINNEMMGGKISNMISVEYCIATYLRFL